MLIACMLSAAFGFASCFAISHIEQYSSSKPLSSDQLTQKLSKFIELPRESPVLATVSDKNQLPQGTFTGKARNGDQILIFLDSKRAILYRPSTGKIVDITTVDTVPTFTTNP